MIHDGWCPDCDARTALIDVASDGGSAWATCTECGTGWVWRDEFAETTSVAAPRSLPESSSVPERRAA